MADEFSFINFFIDIRNFIYQGLPKFLLMFSLTRTL